MGGRAGESLRNPFYLYAVKTLAHRKEWTGTASCNLMRCGPEWCKRVMFAKSNHQKIGVILCRSFDNAGDFFAVHQHRSCPDLVVNCDLHRRLLKSK